MSAASRAHAMHQAAVAGDVDAMRRACEDAGDFPNSRDECGETCLEYAIYQGPVAFVRALLALGADPNFEDPGGFPALFAAIDRAAPDRHEVLELLLAAGADIHRRGVNDFTALHQAASRDDAAAVEILLRHGADPLARTRIDEYATPLEEAALLGKPRAAEALRRWMAEHGRLEGRDA